MLLMLSECNYYFEEAREEQIFRSWLRTVAMNDFIWAFQR